MELIFVYNADSGILNLLKDAAHKMLRPETYPCSLCALTYGAVSEKRLWREFRKGDGRNMRFLHKDEFEVEFGERHEYPVVLEQDKSGCLSIVLSRQTLDALQDVDSLILHLSSQPAKSTANSTESHFQKSLS